MFRYLERSELESGDLGDMALVCDWARLPRDGARELPREGGGRRSDEDRRIGEGFSASGDVLGGTMVASDIWLPDLCLGSDRGGGGGSFVSSFDSSLVPFSSASSVISLRRRRRRELDEEVIDPDAVWRRHADDKALSLRSEAWVIGSTVSFGVNFSVTD